MKKVDIDCLGKENVIELIGKEWMLVTAGDTTHYNTMTASWGGVGFLWNKPVAFVFVRPERHTHRFIEEHTHLTLSFYGNDHREALTFCGTKSGRDYDKAKETGLTPMATEQGCITFAQARLTIVGRKLFKAAMQADNFIDKACLEKWYNDRPGGSLHDVYIVEIEEVYTAD